MRLYFLRHAEAAPGDDDAARELTRSGREQVRVLAKFLNRAEIRFDAAYSSPLVRARQTARLLLKRVPLISSDGLQVTDVLLNGASQRTFQQWLRQMPQARHVLLVGHMPSLSEHISLLFGVPASGSFDLAKGALTCVQTEPGRTVRLKFSVTPSSLGLR